MKLKVLVADKFPEKYIQQMKDLDLDVIYQPKLEKKIFQMLPKKLIFLLSDQPWLMKKPLTVQKS